MPYTLAKGLGWVLVAVVLGIIIGWLLRSVAARRQVERARSGQVDTPEVERLRARVANLETVVDERDRLRGELAAARAAPAAVDDAPVAQGFAADVGSGETGSIGETDVRAGSDSGTEDPPDDAAPAHDAAESPAESPVHLDEASAVIGKRVVADDLTVIEGIGPKISELCHGIGITSWAEMSATEVSLLRTMLTDAGQRFKAHDPSTWPRQAAMLAAGDWADFTAWTDDLQGGRAVE